MKLLLELISALVIWKQALTETFSDYSTHPLPTIYYLIRHEKHLQSN